MQEGQREREKEIERIKMNYDMIQNKKTTCKFSKAYIGFIRKKNKIIQM